MKVFSTGLIVILLTAASAAATTETLNFSTIDLTEFFCGTALPAVRPASVVRPPHAGSVTVDVSISGFAFDPPNLTINVGDTVRWTNNDGTNHSTTSNTGVWDSGLFITGTFSFTFTDAGSFPYFCTRHPSMTALITVKGGSTPTNTPTSTATPTDTPTPAETPSVSGVITYGNAISSPAPPRFIKNVSVGSTAGSPPVGPVITGLDGQYTLSGFGSGVYTIKPTKAGGPNTSITSNDAARVAQGVSGAMPFVSQNQRFAADTSGNGGVSSQDAAFIARFAAGLTGFGNTGQWKFFIPPGAPSPLPTAPQTYNGQFECGMIVACTNQMVQDFVGLLVGEASGNYNTVTHPRPGEKPITVTVQPAVMAEKAIVIPVRVEGVIGKEVISYEFNVRYDPSVIEPLAEPVDVAKTASRGLLVVTNPYEPGLLRVVVYGPMPIAEDGVLLNLRFAPVGKTGSVSPLSLERIIFNDGEPRVSVSDGQVGLF